MLIRIFAIINQDSCQYFVATKLIKARDCGYTAKEILPSLGIIFGSAGCIWSYQRLKHRRWYKKTLFNFRGCHTLSFNKSMMCICHMICLSPLGILYQEIRICMYKECIFWCCDDCLFMRAESRDCISW